ncbi:transcriptional regulator GcvA [Leucothrix mucor]|jgi:LysR family glycine cleavage system transcriptional activator|uniref:transcriptional regulator GcvA n=1 Tax=Leucothrix mucor TaxID=45248 RepID=UPI000423596B|nr:transcriptional regulator GcvA [Leucothrix mucor]
MTYTARAPLPPLNALKAFEVAARHLNLTKAAAELFVTPAAVSRHIKVLEEYLDVTLFIRGNQGLELTEVALHCYPKLSTGFATLADAVAEIRQRTNRRQLTVGMAPSFASKWFIPRMNQFTEMFPDIDLRIISSSDYLESYKGAKHGRDGTDVSIRFGKGSYPDCEVKKMFSVSVTPLCSPTLLDGEFPLDDPENLRHYTLIHDDTLHGGQQDWDTWLEAAGVSAMDTSRGSRFNHVSLALEAAVAGHGVVLTIGALASKDISQGRLIAPFQLSLPLDYNYYLVIDKDKQELTTVNTFVDWIFSEIESEKR